MKNHIARSYLSALACALLMARFANAADTQFAGSTPLQWSVRMADAQLARRGEGMKFTQGGRGKWDYANNVFALSVIKLGQAINQPKYGQQVDQIIGTFIAKDGTIQTYRADEYTLDNINPGKTLLALYKINHDERYKLASQKLREQLKTHPRTSDGGFWHKQVYPHQMWLDGIYMASPFLAEYAQVFNEPGLYDEVAKQIKLMDEHSYDPKTGLFYHGWDESKEQSWADKTTGRSPSFWSRAIGWYGMALVDTLDYFPADHAARPQIIAILNKLAAGVVKHQDTASGLWYQVTDQGNRQGNYLEATSSCMFVYTLAKGINKGYISRDDYTPATTRGYSGIIDKLIKVESNGTPTLTKCCSVAGLGNGRDGTFEYYLREPIVDNDMKGVGPFVMAGIELQQLLGLPSRP